MADKNNYTTIRIREDSRMKLEALRKDSNLSFSDIIENLLRNEAGAIINDIHEARREKTAFSIRFIDFKKQHEEFLHITFHELNKSKIGDVFMVRDSSTINSENFLNETAKVCFIDERSVFVRINQKIMQEYQVSDDVQMVHIDLF